MVRAFSVVLIAASLLVAGPASAAKRAEGPPEPLLIAPGTDLSLAGRMAVDSVGEPVLLEDLVRDAVGSDARLYGASQVVPCTGAALPPGTLPRVVQDSEQFLLDLEYQLAGRLLQEAAAALPCAEHLVARAPLSELFFLLGVSASYAGDAERAQRWFGQASPSRPTAASTGTSPRASTSST